MGYYDILNKSSGNEIGLRPLLEEEDDEGSKL